MNFKLPHIPIFEIKKFLDGHVKLVDKFDSSVLKILTVDVPKVELDVKLELTLVSGLISFKVGIWLK